MVTQLEMIFALRQSTEMHLFIAGLPINTTIHSIQPLNPSYIALSILLQLRTFSKTFL